MPITQACSTVATFQPSTGSSNFYTEGAVSHTLVGQHANSVFNTGYSRFLGGEISVSFAGTALNEGGSINWVDGSREQALASFDTIGVAMEVEPFDKVTVPPLSKLTTLTSRKKTFRFLNTSATHGSYNDIDAPAGPTATQPNADENASYLPNNARLAYAPMGIITGLYVKTAAVSQPLVYEVKLWYYDSIKGYETAQPTNPATHVANANPTAHGAIVTAAIRHGMSGASGFFSKVVDWGKDQLIGYAKNELKMLAGAGATMLL